MPDRKWPVGGSNAPRTQQHVIIVSSLPEFSIRSGHHVLHRDRGVVVGDLGGYTTEIVKRQHVCLLERLGALRRISQDEEGVAVRQAHHRQVRFHVLRRCQRVFAEVELGFTGWLDEWDEDLARVSRVRRCDDERGTGNSCSRARRAVARRCAWRCGVASAEPSCHPPGFS